ncbi:putative Flp pilus assembly protein, secretin CpaC [Vibrio nigripulchritudo MADA3029]|uniref:Putative Flp pilus assembly protein, secretin CpaC n=1 Tax=Vibrio nigripulchritudo TaxID=28173 RepID=U4KFP5_9VIBR|nr:general secretion pathway protein GspD [Vibrio nigripulchritudo]CCN46118.1 putative Flp pilus assembly protein, secretin CpaC [Vibrio nigripulchritudo MADA3020]CCN51167.1 putative Flp pilus assembly protein, secretin CpaC [Vibrio nigripulchritudo MADA3021]CCN56859.1 putative Flp pilus assembly protein, secretin CpaC [Vibrio nigripulchritudo MADA3029]CCN83441.1 putative Flp pilus assembly protein, secretin CpaC [Vibrio nigripulchritudo BLFn1]CCN88800.1 putative Flp pilus assembly protein, se
MKILSLMTFLVAIISPIIVMGSDLVSIDQGAAKTVKTSRTIDTVFVSDQKVADYKVIDETKIVIHGVSVGTASLIIFDRGGNEIYNSEIIVNKSLRLVKQMLVAHFPDEEVNITNVGDQVVLDGTVQSEEIKKNIYRLVGEMLKKKPTRSVFSLSKEDAGTDDDLDYTESFVFEGIIDNLKVLSTEQINVKLTVAEVSSNFLSELGVSYSNVGQPGKYVKQILEFSAEDIVAVIAASKDDSIGQVLAEPNLSVISGETASFLVGGELPMVVRDRDGVTITYKEYGIKLSMVGKVTDSENIRLTLLPEVSSIDASNSQSNAFYNMPSLRTRKAQTTVQLKDGQSFVLAGLLTTEERETLSRVPVLGDIPILGALFSHTKSDRTKTELIIVATVNLVDPVKTNEIKLPKFKASSDLERLFRINLSDPEVEQTIKAGGF